MPVPPVLTNDQYDALGRANGRGNSSGGGLFGISGVLDKLSGGSNSGGFEANVAPSSSGFGTRQSRIPNNRPGTERRHLMRWLVPEQPIIQMYVNPQNFKVDYKKQISKVRTKGGYVLQYWGEDLTTLNIGGTTGTSGIEGINVLYDVYRNEQLMIDPYALFLQADRDIAEDDNLTGFGGTVTTQIQKILTNAKDGGISNVSRTKPTLASLAFTVELYWSGEVWRGYFESFSVTESAERLGLFDYNMTFTVTQKRGFRKNFLGWHRSATSGPSNSSSYAGTPHSFAGMASPIITAPRNRVDQPPLNSTYPSLGNGAAGKTKTPSIIDPFEVF
jgi:hypothetical protein